MKKTFYDSVLKIDPIKVRKSISQDEMESLLETLNETKYCRYFFYDLNNPLFVSFESFRRFISTTLSEINSQRSYFITEYLKRIAAQDSKYVADILHRSTPKDANIYRSLIEIIILLENRDAGMLAEYCIKNLIGKGFAEGDVLNRLLLKYLNCNMPKQALMIFNHITTPIEREISQSTIKEFSSINRKESEGLLEQYEYNDIIETSFPKLCAALPEKTVSVLEQNLFKCLEIEEQSSEVKLKEDYSYIWRPAIEDHPQNMDFGKIKELLVSLLRDSLISLTIDKENRFLRTKIRRYLKSPYSIYQRIALFILSERIDNYQQEIERILSNKKMLEDHRIQHELYRLLKMSYPQLQVKNQKYILKWIDDGPEIKWWVKWRTKEEGKKPSEDRINEFKDHWRLERYWVIRKHIIDSHPEIETKISQLEKSFGTPIHPDFPSWHEDISFGYPSPINVTDFLMKSDVELIEILINPPPAKEPHPIFEHQGLGIVFAEAIKQNPSRFLAFAKLLSINKVVPVFINHYFQGLRDVSVVTKADWKLTLTPDLETLALLVASDSPNTYEWTAYDRSGARLSLCRLIESIVSDRSKSLTDEELIKIKNLIILMIGDPDPDESDESNNYATNHDWDFISLNHTSGQALRTLIKYALCYARKYSTEGLRLEADVKRVFESILDHESRASVFSVFGTYLANLWYLDAIWTKNNLSKIFPKRDKNKYSASWNSYLKFNNVYKDVYEGVKSYYWISINDLRKNKRKMEHDANRMAQHLSLVYWRDWEDVTESDSVVSYFFAKASISQKVSFIRQIGMGLREMKQANQLASQPKAWQRAKKLWMHRIKKARSLQGSSLQEDEISAFLDWLSVCPEEVGVMKDVISQSLVKWKAKYHGGAVTEYLALNSNKYPNESIQLLELFFNRPWDKYYYHFDEKEVRQIMSNALEQGGKPALLAAKIASRLGEYGRFDFKDIWDSVYNN